MIIAALADLITGLDSPPGSQFPGSYLRYHIFSLFYLLMSVPEQTKFTSSGWTRSQECQFHGAVALCFWLLPCELPAANCELPTANCQLLTDLLPYRDYYTSSRLSFTIFWSPVDLVFLDIPILLEVASHEPGHCLVEPGIEPALVFLDDLVTVIARLPVDQFHQYLSLVNG